MTWWDGFIWLVLAVIFVQGIVAVRAPERVAAYNMWKYRLIGARPAEPGPFTLNFYRATGSFAIIVSLVLAAKQLFDF
ncbi:hypothetical protein [Sphingomonas sp.]|uniref:hypothetical protein n=1 Tax=Sphingomonas sp. TaxID=28214 RepID=UPI0031DFB17F